jgi:uncharacterized membrane protein
MVGAIRIRSGPLMHVSRSFAEVAAFALAVLAASLLLVAIAEPRWLSVPDGPRPLLLVDRSDSVPTAALESALAECADRLAGVGVTSIRVDPFAVAGTANIEVPTGQLALAASMPIGTPTDGTDIAAALRNALASADDASSGIVVVSDGWSTRGRPASALQAARDAGIPVAWRAAASTARALQIHDVRPVGSAHAGEAARLVVELDAHEPARVEVVATLAAVGVGSRTIADVVPSHGEVNLALVPPRAGQFAINVEVSDAVSGTLLARRPAAAVLDVVGPPAVMYVGRPGAALARSLRAGGWQVEVTPTESLDARASALNGYRSIVLDDVAYWDASESFWRRLDAAVRSAGVGLVVLGGVNSFASGGYRNTIVERLLPVVSEPPALQSAARIMFAIDASGSMAAAAPDVARLDLARRAVLATVATFGAADRAGIMTFDVEPHLLAAPQTPARLGAAIDRAWSTAAQGGTKLAPALDAAIDLLASDSAQSRRLLILLTDGFIAGESLGAQRARLAESKVELIAVAIGPDADVDALQPLAQASGGRVLRVAEIAELPALLPAQIDALRSRVAAGRIEVRQVRSLPFFESIRHDWPTLSGYDVVRAVPDAQVYMESAAGDPLLAAREMSGARVLALPAGLSGWATDWIRWSEWPRLAGGLIEFASAGFDADTPAIEVEPDDAGFRVVVDVAEGAAWSDGPAPQLEVEAPDGRVTEPALQASGPGHWTTTVPATSAGVYRYAVSARTKIARTASVGHRPTEAEFSGLNPDVDQWRRDGLILDWPQFLSSLASRGTSHPRNMSALLVGALLLAGAGWLLERLVDRMQ